MTKAFNQRFHYAFIERHVETERIMHSQEAPDELLQAVQDNLEHAPEAPDVKMLQKPQL